MLITATGDNTQASFFDFVLKRPHRMLYYYIYKFHAAAESLPFIMKSLLQLHCKKKHLMAKDGEKK